MHLPFLEEREKKRKMIHEIGPNFKLVLFHTFVRYEHCSMTQRKKNIFI